MSHPTNNYFAHSLLRARDWQHRPQLDDVCDWWRGGGRGVCALIGMGGAGKTAVAERFLRILPGGLAEDPDIGKNQNLPTPHSVFVFSFYDAPNSEAFFEALQMWLEETPRLETILSIGQMVLMLHQRPGLIVIDGLERVQHDGLRGDFGRLHSPKLRDFLNRLASGSFPHLSVLVTSRFPLSDLRDRHQSFFRLLPVSQISLRAGVQLLRDRGVVGTDLQLEPVVEEQRIRKPLSRTHGTTCGYKTGPWQASQFGQRNSYQRYREDTRRTEESRDHIRRRINQRRTASATKVSLGDLERQARIPSGTGTNAV